MYNLKLKEREVKRNSKALKSISMSNSLSFDDIPSDDEWITEKENPSLPTKGDWFDILDRATHLQASTRDGDGDVECIARNLREACPDEFGSLMWKFMTSVMKTMIARLGMIHFLMILSTTTIWKMLKVMIM